MNRSSETAASAATYASTSPTAGWLRRYSANRKMPPALTSSSIALSVTMPSHLPSRYCHAATGLVTVCQMILSRCSAVIDAIPNASVRNASTQNTPVVEYWKNDCTRYRSGWSALSRLGSTASPSISRMMSTSEIFIRTASVSMFRATLRMGPEPPSITSAACIRAVNAALRIITPIMSRP